MATLTEARHTAEFILSAANGHRSFENGTLKVGEDLAAGTVLMLDSDELVAFDGASDVDVVGILMEDTDADDAAMAVSYLARDAEVNLATLTYPSGTGDEAATISGLALLGIITRS